jgi:dihydroxyacetone kinase-like protein
MEIGMGIHGEPGVRRGKLAPADRITELLLDALLGDLPLAPGAEVSVLVNGLGATPKEELYVMYRRVHQLLAGRGVQVYRPYIGEYATSMEMAGASVSLCQLDAELRPLLDAPAATPFVVQV